MNLNLKWKEIKNEANTQNLMMTVAEVIRLYNRGRLSITPSYQRVYRWTNEQKSRFIESLLLKYPIPPIITIQTEDEKGFSQYEIIDGAQRISTILEFMSSEVDKEKRVKNFKEDFKCIVGAEVFKELNGKTWSDFKDEDFDFTFEASPILFTNFTSGDESIKFDVFTRVNTLSTKLSEQEIRNSILAFKDKIKYLKISEEIFKESKFFIGKANISKRQDMEFFLEFSLIKNQGKYQKQIDDKIKSQLKINTKDKDKHFNLMLSTYAELVDINDLLEDLSDYKDFLIINQDLWFKKFDPAKDVTSGLPIKFFFEILSYIYFIDKTLINKELYRENFSETYHDIVKYTLNSNNPNAKNRFELAKKVTEGFDGHGLFD